MTEKYDDIMSTINEMFKEFMCEAEAGKEGRKSKQHALTARKISTKIATTLKEFRVLSIINDKAKVTNGCLNYRKL